MQFSAVYSVARVTSSKHQAEWLLFFLFHSVLCSGKKMMIKWAMTGVGGGIKDSKATFKQSHCLLAKHSLADGRKDIAAIVAGIIKLYWHV